MTHHAVFSSYLNESASEITISGEEARHAVRVKRLREGELLTILNGRGLRAAARVINAGRGELTLQICDRAQEPPLVPRIDVWSALPKGPRASELIDGLCQVGAASWRPLWTGRVHQRADAKRVARLERVAIEAMKQCGRVWALELGAEAPFTEALQPTGGVRLVMAEARGAPPAAHPGDERPIRVLVGPEGGWTDAELDQARSRGVEIASCGPHVMRIETAAPVAAALLRRSAY